MKNEERVKKMITDEEEIVRDWKNKHGSVTGYSFMIYGPMTVKDNAIINKGLTLILINEGYGELRYVQVTEEVNLEKANMYDLKRGWNVQWVFPGDVPYEVSDIIHNTLEEGLEFLRLSYQFLGTMGGAGNVTNAI